MFCSAAHVISENQQMATYLALHQLLKTSSHSKILETSSFLPFLLRDPVKTLILFMLCSAAHVILENQQTATYVPSVTSTFKKLVPTLQY